MKTNSSQRGFILPSVLLIGLGTMIIGLSLIQTSTSIRGSIDNLYYNKIAAEASEAGAAYATYCLKTNDYNQTWGHNAGRPNLTQDTDCTGKQLDNPISSLTKFDDIKATFSVGDISRGNDSSYLISSTSQLNVTSSTGIVIRTASNTSLKAVGADAIKFGPVTFGYYPSSSPISQDGAFFAVRGSDGIYRVVGANQVGQLGNGSTNNTLTPQAYKTPGTSPAVNAFSNFVSQGYNLFVLTQDGNVYGAGLGDSGQLGNHSTTRVNPNPVRFDIGSETANFVAPKGDATFVLTNNNNIYAAGDCNQGQLGINNAGCGNLANPTRVMLPAVDMSNPNTIPTTNIVLDANTVYVRMQGGAVYGWGRNTYGQLATGNKNQQNIPVKVGPFGDPGKPQATKIAFDGDTIFIVGSDGKAYAAGRNDYGQFGMSHYTSTYTTIQQIPIPASAGNVLDAATDQWTGVFLTSSGQVWDTGLNIVGELGNNKTASYTDTPQQFIIPTDPDGTQPKGIKIYNAGTGNSGSSSRFNNTFVVADNGKVYGAGSNYYGQLGIGGTSAYEKYPKVMHGFDGFNLKAEDIVTGLGTTIVLSTDKIYYTMGNNNYGQLGTGNTNPVYEPTAAEYLKSIPAYIF